MWCSLFGFIRDSLKTESEGLVELQKRGILTQASLYIDLKWIISMIWSILHIENKIKWIRLFNFCYCNFSNWVLKQTVSPLYQLWPSLCALPGHVPDRLSLYRGGNTQLHRGQPGQFLQDENGKSTKNNRLHHLFSVRDFNFLLFSSHGRYSLSVFNFLQISHIIREIRQFQQTAYKIDFQPKVRFSRFFFLKFILFYMFCDLNCKK